MITPDSLTTPIPSPARRTPAWLLPLLILAGFAGLFLFILKDELLPAPTVYTKRAEYAAPSTPSLPVEQRAQLLFRATGWIIADPYPIAATTYIPGRIIEVPVTEGDTVQKGQMIARLDPHEYELALAHAQSELDAAEAHAAAAEATRAEAEAMLTALQERTANYTLRHTRYTRLSTEAVSEQQRTDAHYDLTEYRARLQAQEATLRAAQSAAQRAQAQQKAAQAARDKAQLDLDRCTITAPISGRIMKLMAMPGARLSPGGETVDMSTAATLYDPQHIALAADVPLDQADKLAVGQQVRISCDTLPNRELHGRVVAIYGQADQTRNTIRCRVSIENPDDMLRPDMQCRGAFYSDGVISSEPEPTATNSDPVRLPAEAISGDTVWVVSPQGLLQRRTITKEGDYVYGVLPGEPVVLEPTPNFTEGQRVNAISL